MGRSQKEKLEALNREMAKETENKPEASLEVIPTPSVVDILPNGQMTQEAESPAISEIDESRFFVKSEPTISSEPAQDSKIQKLEAEIQKYKEEARIAEERWKSAQGMYRKTEDENLLLEEKLTRIENQVKALSEQPQSRAKVVEEDPEEVFDEKDLAIKDAFPTIEKLARKIAREQLRAKVEPLQQKLSALEKEHLGVTENVQKTHEQAFVQMVRNSVGTEDFDAITNGTFLPQWKEYLGQRVMGSDATLGQFLDIAHKNKNFERVVEVFNSFKTNHKPKVSALNSMMAPNLGSVGSTTIKEKPKLKQSALTLAYEDTVRRRNGMTKEKMHEIEKMYEQAKKENRIDYNA